MVAVVPESKLRHVARGPKGLFLLLRYVFIASASYLLLFQSTHPVVAPALALAIALALASNVALSFVPAHLLFSWWLSAPMLVADTLWVAWALHSARRHGRRLLPALRDPAAARRHRRPSRRGRLRRRDRGLCHALRVLGVTRMDCGGAAPRGLPLRDGAVLRPRAGAHPPRAAARRPQPRVGASARTEGGRADGGADAPLRGHPRRQQRQDRLPRQHVARGPDAAPHHHRVRGDAGRRWCPYAE